MNPNNVNRFSSAAVGVNRQRSKFHRPSKHLTSFNAGELVPLYIDEVVPGDNFEITARALTRMSTPIFPTMDNAYLDLYAFFVPNRIIYDDWKELMGENNSDYWTETVERSVPQIKFYHQDRHAPFIRRDVLGYLGVPPLSGSSYGDFIEVSALPTRAYVQVWNDWFRDQNTESPAHLYKDGVTRNYSYFDAKIDAELGGKLLPVSKFKDYFTSALPGAQKGNAVTLPLGNVAPVITGDGGVEPLAFAPYGGAFNDVNTGGFYPVSLESGTVNSGELVITNSAGAEVGMYPTNLYANLAEATASTVNQIRLAFQTQKYLETLARSGSRYVESLYSLYGVYASDRSLQRSEYLGGIREPISITSVAQTSSTSDVSPQGNLAAYSVTGLSKKLSDHYFEEHGFIIIVGCVRVDQTYSQGCEKFWFRKDRFDFYAPVFANLGEMPILNKEIYLTGNSTQNDEVFGYQEAWAEYRYKPNRVSGLMSPLTQDALTAWNYANNFESLPVLTTGFMHENGSIIDRTLAVSSDVADQFIIDLYVDNYTTRVMPMYSVPGLIDHA